MENEAFPIVTTVTKLQLDALVSGSLLEKGLQYEVSDKGWRLLATSNNTLTTINGRIELMITDSLPAYINVDEILYSSELITDFTGNTSFLVETGFYAISGLFDGILVADDPGFTGITFTICDVALTLSSEKDYYSGVKIYLPFTIQQDLTLNTIIFSCTVPAGSNSCRFYILCRKYN